MNNPLTITDKAILKMKEFLAATPEAVGIRVGVLGSGCSGFSWSIDLEIEIKQKDFTFDVDGVSIIIDTISAQYLKNTSIDWLESKMSAGFAFSNPNAKTCGCKKSFNL